MDSGNESNQVFSCRLSSILRASRETTEGGLFGFDGRGPSVSGLFAYMVL